MLQTNNLRYYADDSVRVMFFKLASWAELKERRLEFLSEIENTLEQVTEPSKTQGCAFIAKKTHFVVAPSFQDTSVIINKSIEFLGVWGMRSDSGVT